MIQFMLENFKKQTGENAYAFYVFAFVPDSTVLHMTMHKILNLVFIELLNPFKELFLFNQFQKKLKPIVGTIFIKLLIAELNGRID